MNGSKKNSLTLLDFIIMVILFCFLSFIYIGFYFPDPHIKWSFGKTFVLLCRLGFPVIALSLLFFYYGIRTRKVQFSSFILSVLSVLLCMLIAFPFAAQTYNGYFLRKKAHLFHPYLQINPQDYRERNTASGKKAFRVFCIGGSTTEFKDKDNKGWPARLEEIFKGYSKEREIQFYNLGRQWYTSLHSLINYSVNLRQHEPDMIIVMHAINDLLQNADFSYISFDKFHDDYRHFHGPAFRLVNRPTTMELVFNLLKRSWYHKPREVINTEDFPGLIPFKRNLSTLIELAHSRGTEVVLMTQPNILKENMTKKEKAVLYMVNFEAVGPNKRWSVKTAYIGMEKYNDAVRKLAKEKGIALIDLEKVIPKSLEYFYDEVHYRQKTFDLLATAISDELKKQELIPK